MKTIQVLIDAINKIETDSIQREVSEYIYWFGEKIGKIEPKILDEVDKRVVKMFGIKNRE